MKKYCQKCGAPTEYTLTKPKFCSKCGTSFEQNQTQSISKKQILINKHEEDDILDEEISDNYKKIENLEFEPIVASKLRGEKLQDIIRQSSVTDKKNKKKKKKTPKSEINKIFKDTLDEAKTLRPKK